MDTGGNVLILNIWSGRDSGPYMHALHFTFGLGAFLAPVIARPFLYNAENSEIDGDSLTAGYNQTSEIEKFYQQEIWPVKALYPLIGCYSIFASVGLFFYFFQDIRKDPSSENSAEDDSNKTELVDSKRITSKFKISVVGILSLMFFFYVGMEVAFGTYVSVFAVKSDLKFTRPQG